MNNPLKKELIRQRKILSSLKNNWNDEGAKKIHQKTITKMVNLIVGSSIYVNDSIPVPSIGPCGDGSIDIHWKNEEDELELLINIPEEGQATFYGDNKTFEYQGAFDVETIEYERLEMLYLLLT